MLTFSSVALAVAALAGIVIVILIGARAAQAGGFVPAPKRLRLVDQLSLSRQATLRIVACDGREMLLLGTATQETLLCWLAAPEVAP